MPATQIEFHDRHKALYGIVDGGHREQSIGMRHETVVSESIS